MPATLDHVPNPQRWTALRKGEAEVRMVEHILATVYGLGIDNLVVEADAAEMPVGDGSALTFAAPFLRAGVKELDAPRRRAGLKAVVGVTDKDTALMAAPHDGGLCLTYVLDYGRHFLRAQSLTVTATRETFLREIAPARTYVLRPEVDAFMKQGLGKGATEENTLVLEEDGTLSGTPRFPDECVRHKLLDLIGDLFFVGAPVSARVVGYKSGHTTNIQLAAAMKDALKA